MTKFEFRLERVLEYRRMTEDWAKQAYGDAHRRRLEADAALAALADRRASLLQAPATSLEHRQVLEAYLGRMDADAAAIQASLAILMQEEERALAEWHDRYRDRKVLEELRERRVEEWRVDEERATQAEQDDAQRRRTA